MIDKQHLAALGEHMREMEECKQEFKVPDGWKLVPLELTKPMLNVLRAGYFRYQEMWDDALAAAPEYKP